MKKRMKERKMKLSGSLSIMNPTIAFKVILWTINCILSCQGAYVMNVHILGSCKQCVFFGHIEEVQRIFTGGSMTWCMFIMSGCLVSFATGVVVLLGVYHKCQNVNNPFHLNQSRLIFTLRASILWTMLAAVVATLGYVVWCKSFKVNSCASNMYMDWFAFTPKHSNCFHARFYQLQINAVLWGSFLWQSYDYYKFMKYK